MLTRRLLAAAALVALGLFVSVLVARPASAWYPDDLPRLGYSVSVINLLEPGCKEWHATGYGASANLGSDCDSGFQKRLDDFINSTCPCVQTTTATVTTPTATTTTEATVTTPPPVDTNAAITTTLAVDPPPPPPPPTVTVTTTLTETVTQTVDQSAEIAAIQARLDALDARVLVLENGVVNGTPDGYAPAGVSYS